MSCGSLSQFSPNLEQPMPTMATLSRMACGFMARRSYDPTPETARHLRGGAHVVLRKVVGDLVPRRLGGDEDVALRPLAGISVERAGGHDGDTALRVEPRHRRAAACAEHLREELSLRDLVGGQAILAAPEAEAVRLPEDVRGMER